MAYATTGGFSKLVVEVEWTASSGIYSRWCGLTSRGVNRQANMQTNESPDCDNEDAPSEVKRSVQSQEVTVSGSGVWAAESHGDAMDWWYSGLSKNVRIRHVSAQVGATEYETGPAFLTQLNNAVEKGGQITAEIAIEFDGLPARTDKS